MGIKRKQKIVGGTKDHPCFEKYGPYLCTRCDVEANKIKTEKKSSSEVLAGGGTLNRNRDEILYQCPKCKEERIIHGHVHESDGTYYSNEERRVYNL